MASSRGHGRQVSVCSEEGACGVGKDVQEVAVLAFWTPLLVEQSYSVHNNYYIIAGYFQGLYINFHECALISNAKFLLWTVSV